MHVAQGCRAEQQYLTAEKIDNVDVRNGLIAVRRYGSADVVLVLFVKLSHRIGCSAVAARVA
jgi:hypothetical protein